MQNSFSGQSVSRYDYAYDKVGRRTSVVNSGAAFAQAAFSAYNYNDRSELIAASRYLGADVADTTQPVAAQARGYLYDPIGNRTQAEKGGVQTNYTANALNQYTAVTGQDTYSPAYDADGNLKNAPDGMRYTYNAENHLIAAQPETPVEGDTRVEFVYDYLGRRVQRLVYTYSAGTWEQNKEVLFVYDGWNLVKETTIAAGQSAVDKYYVWGLDLSQSLRGAGGVGGLLAVVDDGNTYHYFYDANGNVGQLVNASNGEIAAHYEFNPFGNVVYQSGSMADDNSFRYSTKYFDDETGIYYYGYRYYSPVLGRWINRDTIEEEGGINLYIFVHNSVNNNFDVLGKQEWDLWNKRTGKQVPKAVGLNAGYLH